MFQGSNRLGATTLQWFGPGFYQITITGVPRNLYSRDSAVSAKWTLTRNLKNCVLQTDTIVVNCPPASPWAEMELSASTESIRNAFVAAQITEDSWTRSAESDSRSLQEPQGARLVLSQVGERPVALLELKTKSVDPKEKDPEPFAYFHFDQTFLAPVAARWKSTRDWIQIQALGDWETRRNRSRFTHVLAAKIDVSVGGIGAASFTRSERELLQSAPPRMPQAITSQVSLEEVLSNEGLRFLNALLETH